MTNNDDDFFTSLYDEGSQSSTVYFDPKRALFRPQIRVKRVVILAILVLIVTAIVGVLTKILVKNYVKSFSANGAGWIASCATLFLFIVIKLKKIIVWLVLFYQRYAKDEIRQRCVFTPSCSQYMILAVKKYGAVRGVIKGIKRIKRCHLPNFGEDYP